MTRKFKLLPWNGRTYKAVQITLFSGTIKEKQAVIAEEDLELQLVDPTKTSWLSAESKELDDQITFYVPAWRITQPPEELAAWVESKLPN